MAQAKIYWDLEHYAMVEKIFRQSAEFCSEHDLWKLNVAHVFFLQESKYKEAIRYYEPAVKKMQVESILKVPAIAPLALRRRRCHACRVSHAPSFPPPPLRRRCPRSCSPTCASRIS